jgi:hypothetical protein
MSEKVSDEMLMAFVDGELEPQAAEEVARAIAAEPGLAQRADAFRTSRRLARDAFAPVMAEPVPERLVDTIMQRDAGEPAPRRAGRACCARPCRWRPRWRSPPASAAICWARPRSPRCRPAARRAGACRGHRGHAERRAAHRPDRRPGRQCEGARGLRCGRRVVPHLRGRGCGIGSHARHRLPLRRGLARGRRRCHARYHRVCSGRGRWFGQPRRLSRRSRRRRPSGAG